MIDDREKKKYLRFLELFKVGIKIDDARNFYCGRITELKDCYAILIPELGEFIKIDKKSFDYNFKNRIIKKYEEVQL